MGQGTSREADASFHDHPRRRALIQRLLCHRRNSSPPQTRITVSPISTAVQQRPIQRSPRWHDGLSTHDHTDAAAILQQQQQQEQQQQQQIQQLMQQWGVSESFLLSLPPLPPQPVLVDDDDEHRHHRPRRERALSFPRDFDDHDLRWAIEFNAAYRSGFYRSGAAGAAGAAETTLSAAHHMRIQEEEQPRQYSGASRPFGHGFLPRLPNPRRNNRFCRRNPILTRRPRQVPVNNQQRQTVYDDHYDTDVYDDYEDYYHYPTAEQTGLAQAITPRIAGNLSQSMIDASIPLVTWSQAAAAAAAATAGYDEGHGTTETAITPTTTTPTTIAQAECAVCLDEFEPEDLVRLLRCSHAFHQPCLDTWLIETNNSCPVCRAVPI